MFTQVEVPWAPKLGGSPDNSSENPGENYHNPATKRQKLVAKAAIGCLISTLLPLERHLMQTRELDEHERLIVRHLIRDPRESDNAIGEITGVNVRTVGRKRQKLEQAGILSYFTHLDLSARGTGQFNARHLY